MSFKTDQLWIERKAKKRLWDVLSIYPCTYDDLLRNCRSADELATKLLDWAIEQRYPEVLRIEKAKEKLEQQFALDIRAEMPPGSEVHHAEETRGDEREN